MFHKTYNAISIMLLMILAVIMYLLNAINITYCLIAIGIYVFLYMLISAIKKEKVIKIFLYPIIGALTAFGVINLTLMTCSVISHINLSNETKMYSEAIMSQASTYKEIFETEDNFYYINRDFTNLVEINKKDYSKMSTYIVQHEDNVDNDLSIFSPFFATGTFSNITKTCNYDIHFALIKDVQENSILIRIIDGEEVYYSYLMPESINEFIKTSNAFKLLKTEGYTNFYITIPSVSVDLNDLNSEKTEIEAIKNTSGLLTVTEDYYYFSDAAYVEYETTPDYVTRINNFYNQETLSEIKELSNILESLEKDSDDREEIEYDILNLQSNLIEHYVELVNEVVGEKETIRYYRVFTPNLESNEEFNFDIISTVELELDGMYMIGKTNIDTFEIFDYKT